jgi:hypothetical protein
LVSDRVGSALAALERWWSPAAARPWWERYLTGACLAFAVVAIVLYDARYHEFWRDEAHTYLFNEHVPLHRFLLAKKVEGHPPLYDLLTVPLVPVLSPFARILVAEAVGFGVLLFGTYRCLLSICLRPVASLVLTALFAASYVYVYELGVVVRCYALGAGFGLLTSAYLRDALRGHSLRPVWLGTAAGAACLLSSTHAATIAAGAITAYGFVSLWRHRGILMALPTLAVLPFLYLLYWEIEPFPGRSGELNLDLKLPHDQFVMMAKQALAGSFTPQDWWVTTVFGDPHVLDRIALLRHWGMVGALAALAYSIVLRLAPDFKSYRPVLVYDVLSIAIGSAGLLEILVNHYWGSPRHHVFLSLPAVVLASGWGAQRGYGPLRHAGALALPALGAWFAFQIWVGARCLLLDVDLPFSDTKAAAALLPRDAHLVADSLTTQESYMLWKPDIVMRGGDSGGRSMGYVGFDSAWHASAPLLPMVREECGKAEDRTFFSGWGWELGGVSACLKTLRPASEHSEQTRPDERFDLSQVDCACVRGVGR